MALYLLACSGVVWAFYQDAWPAPSGLASSEGRDSGAIRLIPFAIGLCLAFMAFLFFGGNRFTLWNLTLWWMALVFYLWGVEERPPQSPSALQRLREKFCGEGKICFSLWQLGVFLSLGALACFHLALLPFPAEPTVDHAENMEDMLNLLRGQWSIFFPRNTGREPLIMYWTVLVAALFRAPISLWIQKLSTVLVGIGTLPWVYLLGKEVGDRRTGWLAMLFFGLAAWPTILMHFGLRIVFHPFFTAAVLYFLLRGLRTHHRNDFLYTGLWLGLGLYSYTAFRVVPLVVLLGMVLYLLHLPNQEQRRDVLLWAGLIFLSALLVFLPLLRYAVEYPASFFYRTFTRLDSWEREIPGPRLPILLSNLWNVLGMFHWDQGGVWAISVPHRPALDVVGGTLFLFGVVLTFCRYLREHTWRDLFLLLALLVLLSPSALSFSFPEENPHPSRAGGAAVIVFLLAALAMDGLMTALERRGRPFWARGALTLLFIVFILHNYRILRQFDEQYRLKIWNPCDYGAVIAHWKDRPVLLNSIWVIPSPEWVDTRLPGLCIGLPGHDFGLPPERIPETVNIPRPKLFILSRYDGANLQQLQTLYPSGIHWSHASKTAWKDLTVFFVP